MLDSRIPSILKKIYSDSTFFNVFRFGGPKIKRIRIRSDIDISQNYVLVTRKLMLSPWYPVWAEVNISQQVNVLTF